MKDIRFYSNQGKSIYDKKLLSLDEFEFYEFKEKRDSIYCFDGRYVQTPCVKGLVSIVLPVYNGGELLVKSIDSVLAQSYDQFELLIVNDGSTDQTPEILDFYAERDSRIRVIHKKNEKLPKTLSRGFKEVRGEFLTWTSADNIMDANCIETLVSELTEFPDTDMVYANVRLIDEDGDYIEDNGWYPGKWHTENVMLLRRITELNTKANNFIGAAFMYRNYVAKALEDYSMYKYGIEDYDYWMRVNENFQLRHICSDKPIYSYRFHSGSLTAQDKQLKITANRYRLMRLDSFRRNYMLKSLAWVIEEAGERGETSLDVINALKKANHKVIDIDTAKQLGASLYERIIYIQFGGKECKIQLPPGTFRVLWCKKPETVNPEEWDCFISDEEVSVRDFLPDHKGWFSFASGEAAFAFIDIKAKNNFLYSMEGRIEAERQFCKEISIVLPFWENESDFIKALCSLKNQNVEKGEFEIIVTSNVANRNRIVQILHRVQVENVKCIYSVEGNKNIYYNIGIWAAEGKLIDLFDERFICSNDYIEKIIAYFSIFKDTSAMETAVLKEQTVHYIYRAEDLLMVGGLSIDDVQDNEFSENEMLLPVLKLKRVKKICHKFAGIEVMMDNAIDYNKNHLLRDTQILYKYQIQKLLPFDLWPDLIKEDLEGYRKFLVKFPIGNLSNRIADIEYLAGKIEEDIQKRADANFIKNKYSLHPNRSNVDKLEYLINIFSEDCFYPAVSVIVPVYQVELYLERCIESILKQTLEYIEILLIDDGSRDGSPQICDRYEQIDKRIRVIHKENGGLSSARNCGLDYATGKYILFVDSDDWIEENMLEELCFAAEYYKADIAECGFENVYKNSSVKNGGDTGLYFVADSEETMLQELRWKYFKCVAWDKVYKRELFDGLRYPVDKLHEDVFLTYQIFSRAKKAVFVDRNLYHYDQTRSDSITGKKFSDKNLDTVEAWRNKTLFFKKKKSEELYKEALDQYSWVACNCLEECAKKGIMSERVETVKEWLKTDYPKLVRFRIDWNRLQKINALMQ